MKYFFKFNNNIPQHNVDTVHFRVDGITTVFSSKKPEVPLTLYYLHM